MAEKDTTNIHKTIEGTPREPLLAAPRSSTEITDDTATTNSTTETTDSNDAPPPSAALLGCCTLALVLVGLALVLFVAFSPLWLLMCGSKIWTMTGHHHHTTISTSTLAIMAVVFLLIQAIHLRLLWMSPFYLYLYRTLVLPIRRLLLPLVPMVCRIESIREQETTQYYQVPSSSNNPVFRKSVRRHYKRMQKIYQRRQQDTSSSGQRIRHVCVRAETNLCLRDIVPIIWEHQQRSTDSSRPIDDFIKRALVVVVVPDGILDLYYKDDDSDPSSSALVSVQFSILQGTVWHWFMYFCRTEHCRDGIWWHGALLAIQRGHELQSLVSLQEPTAVMDHSTTNSSGEQQEQERPIVWVNAQTHQQDSKLHAGYSVANHTQRDLLSKIYPQGWISTRHIPESILQMRLWDD